MNIHDKYSFNTIHGESIHICRTLRWGSEKHQTFHLHRSLINSGNFIFLKINKKSYLVDQRVPTGLEDLNAKVGKFSDKKTRKEIKNFAIKRVQHF